MRETIPMLRRLPIVYLVGMLLFTACGRQAQQSTPTPPPPTRIPTATPEANTLLEAESVVRSFLAAWERSDFETMYGLISTAAQEAYGYETFRAFYQDARDEMRLLELSHVLRIQARESNRVMLFVYDVTFATTVVGAFTDAGREIRLVLDGDEWRVAWTPADIFAELRGGATLRQTIFTPRRASIYDRDGEILADMNGRVVIVKVIRNQIPNLETCLNTLSSALNLTSAELQTRLENNAPNWLAEIGTLEPDAYLVWQETLESNCNARFDNRATRRYLDGELAPHIVGTVGYPTEDEVMAVEAAGFRRDSILGRAGIELSWDETLRGQPGGQLTIVSPDGEIVRLLAETVTEPGQSVYLTLDSELQRFIWREFMTLYTSDAPWVPESRGAAAVVMDVNTGAILAMVSYPPYNANAFVPFPVIGWQTAQDIVAAVQNDPRRPQLNRAAQGRYPTGSVMKPVTAIAALDSSSWAFDETYFSVGSWTRDITRYDWLAGGHGRLTLSNAITHSCNSCFYEVGYRLDNVDPYLLPRYANRMGFGVPTGLTDIPESAGLIGTPDFKRQVTGISWTFSDAVDMAVGQGFVEVTPLQVARTYAAIANGGTLYRPQLVDHVALLDTVSYTLTPDPTETGVDSDVLAFVREGLCGVTTQYYGTAEYVFRNSRLMDEFSVCGKTGTAQNPGGDSHAWFVAYAPAENPEIVIAVVVENAGEGSEVAAPLVRRVLEYYFFELRSTLTVGR